MKPELDNPSVHRYMRVYNYYKQLILSQQLAPGSRLPSIRRCAAELQMSRTTVETAYMVLAAEGYIISRPQSGFYVTEIARTRRQAEQRKKEIPQQKQKVRYNFASAGVDKETFRFELWRRYIKSALRQDERLLSYGEPQGEYDLREVLCRYLQNNRNVVCTPEHIVIGAGIQSLLHILCPLIQKRKQVFFYNPGFRQGRAIFEDYNFQICGSKKVKPDVCYVSPSQITSWGEVLSVQERMKLLREASRENMLLIEDDYNSEFCYVHHPAPSIQGLAGGEGVVYLGTFSRMLLPSIRLSFMVLPSDLLEQYEKRKDFYNQTASKAEQIALCQFIRDGHLESQIRKARKYYQAKSKLLCQEAQRIFGDRAEVTASETDFLSLLEIRSEKKIENVLKETAKYGILVLPAGESDRGIRLALSCAAVSTEEFSQALILLKQCV
jgi:GntR family transcriptional regulator/MocR family aminotransferase